MHCGSTFGELPWRQQIRVAKCIIKYCSKEKRFEEEEKISKLLNLEKRES